MLPKNTITRPNIINDTVVIDYVDGLGIDVTTLSTGNIAIDPPAALVGQVDTPVITSVAFRSLSFARTRVTYAFTPPAGAWARAHFGSWTVRLLPNQVRDTSGTAAAGRTLRQFSVAVVGRIRARRGNGPRCCWYCGYWYHVTCTSFGSFLINNGTKSYFVRARAGRALLETDSGVHSSLLRTPAWVRL
jgi:hypothetical protein